MELVLHVLCEPPVVAEESVASQEPMVEMPTTNVVEDPVQIIAELPSLRRRCQWLLLLSLRPSLRRIPPSRLYVALVSVVVALAPPNIHKLDRGTHLLYLISPNIRRP